MKHFTLRSTVAVVIAIISLQSGILARAATTEYKNPYGDPQVYTAYGYCPCEKCCGKTDGITKSGNRLIPGLTVAVDTSVIPLGKTVIIYDEDYTLVGIYQADDTGGGIKGHTLDICFATHQDALNWGKRKCYVQVIDAVG